MPQSPLTVREKIVFCYANLARAHAALDRGARRYAPVDHMIRARLQSSAAVALTEASARVRKCAQSVFVLRAVTLVMRRPAKG